MKFNMEILCVDVMSLERYSISALKISCMYPLISLFRVALFTPPKGAQKIFRNPVLG
jgi:hypothetical protein